MLISAAVSEERCCRACYRLQAATGFARCRRFRPASRPSPDYRQPFHAITTSGIIVVMILLFRACLAGCFRPFRSSMFRIVCHLEPREHDAEALRHENYMRRFYCCRATPCSS